LVEYKGIPYLINSMRNIDAKLHIVGTGPLEQELKRMSKDLINVKFLGRVENLEKEFYDASVLILPSINAAEMFGIVQIEAFARGIPVISTSIPNSGVQLVNRDNHTGYTCAACSSKALEETINKFFLNSYKFDSKIIRKEYLSKYSNEKFKENLLKIL
jgi:rhamnosyl/mannosyltransferase